MNRHSPGPVLDVEPWLMRTPARAWVQRHVEAPLLAWLTGPVQPGPALEIGCGTGVGLEIIRRRFAAAPIAGFDLEPHLVDAARRRSGAHLWVGDAAAIPLPDDSVDAVFDFAVLHHVPDWRAGVGEVARVLRPGGRFVFEEVLRGALDSWLLRTFTEHPPDDRFDADQLLAQLRRAGLEPHADLRVGTAFVLGAAVSRTRSSAG